MRLNVVCAQCGYLAGRQVTPCARRQPGQTDGPDTHAGQFGNGVTDSGQHAAHLPIAPFKDGQLYLRPAVVGRRRFFSTIRPPLGLGRNRAHRPDRDILRAARRAVFQHDARAQAPQGVVGWDAAHLRPVCLGDMVLGVRHLVKEVPVVS